MRSSTDTASPTSTDTGTRSVRVARRWAVLATLAASSLALTTACSDEQRTALGEEDVRSSLAEHVTTDVESSGLELGGDLDCTANIGTDGALTAECTGTTGTGEGVAGVYTGTADVDAETCTARLVTTIGDEPATDRSDVDCFNAG